MGERKVLNKYFPPDFDHTKIQRRKLSKEQRTKKVRMMLPMSVRCNTCGVYIYKGTKFNSRQEDVPGDEGKYLGLQIFRFFFHCPRCSSELHMRTDPKNSDYVVEGGMTRNYEPWRAEAQNKDLAKEERAAEELGDAMRALENRTIESKEQIDVLAALDDMRSLNARHERVDPRRALEALRRQAGEDAASALAAEDEDAIAAALFGAAAAAAATRRLPSDDEAAGSNPESDGGEFVFDGAGGGRAVDGRGGEGDSRDGGEGGAPSAKRPRRDGPQAGVSESAAGERVVAPGPAVGFGVRPLGGGIRIVASKARVPAPAAAPAAVVGAGSGALAGLGGYGSGDSDG